MSLPNRYTEVEYIYNPGTGNNWINLGLTGGATCGYEINMKITTVSRAWARYFGGDDLPYEYPVLESNQGSVGNYPLRVSLDGSTVYWTFYPSESWFNLKLDGNNFYYNDSLKTSSAYNAGWGATAFNIFSTTWYGGGAQAYWGKCKFYTDGILVRELVPVVDSQDNDKPGFYDLVNDVFYDNDGEGTITAGEKVYRLTVNVNPEGSGTVDIVKNSNNTYTLTAEKSGSYEFNSFTIDGVVVSYYSTYVITLTEDTIVTANFSIPVPAVNKVVYNNNTLLDLTSDTVTKEDVAIGKTFHLPNGKQAVGTLSNNCYEILLANKNIIYGNGVLTGGSNEFSTVEGCYSYSISQISTTSTSTSSIYHYANSDAVIGGNITDYLRTITTSTGYLCGGPFYNWNNHNYIFKYNGVSYSSGSSALTYNVVVFDYDGKILDNDTWLNVASKLNRKLYPLTRGISIIGTVAYSLQGYNINRYIFN